MKSSKKQFRDTQRVPFMYDKTRKPLFPQLETFFSKNVFFLFSKMSHIAENTEQSPMLAKRFVSSKSRGGFDTTSRKKSHSAEKMTVLKKK